MNNFLIKILLGPLLLIQGWWVRKHTPVLPEPEMPPTGVLGNGKRLRLLLLGDSSAAGVGAEHAEQSLLAQLLENLSSEFKVEYKMLAKTGRKTAQMLALLAVEPKVKYDVVITALGVNDVTSQVTKSKWIAQQQQLIRLIGTPISIRLDCDVWFASGQRFSCFAMALECFSWCRRRSI